MTALQCNVFLLPPLICLNTGVKACPVVRSNTNRPQRLACKAPAQPEASSASSEAARPPKGGKAGSAVEDDARYNRSQIHQHRNIARVSIDCEQTLCRASKQTQNFSLIVQRFQKFAGSIYQNSMRLRHGRPSWLRYHEERRGWTWRRQLSKSQQRTTPSRAIPLSAYPWLRITRGLPSYRRGLHRL